MARKYTEHRVAETILQEGIKVTIGNKEYLAPSPTTGTLYCVAREISSIQKISPSAKWDEVLGSAIVAPKIATILAIFIIGAKALKFSKKSHLPRFLSFLQSSPQRKLDKLTVEILEECSAVQLGNILAQFLEQSGLNDFFALTTFLREANPTKPTKVVNETTAPGQ